MNCFFSKLGAKCEKAIACSLHSHEEEGKTRHREDESVESETQSLGNLWLAQ